MSPIAYSPKITYDGLVGYWDAANSKSYPGSGTIWRDLSGNGNHGTLSTGSIGTVSGSGVMAFNGTSDYVNCGNDNSLKISEALTICAWIKPNTGVFMNIVGDYTGDNRSQHRFAIGVYGKPRFDSANVDGTMVLESTNAVVNGAWSYVAVIRESSIGTINHYTNGILNGSGVSSNVPPNGEVDNTEIGASGNGTENFNGKISNVQIYNRALSQSEITQNFQAHRSRYGI